MRNGFWRVFGIRLLDLAIVAGFIASAVAAPFNFVGHLLTIGRLHRSSCSSRSRWRPSAAAIGQIITAPFSAGVVVLLYTDRRIRAEAFDLVLQTGAAGGPPPRQPPPTTSG